MAIGYYGTKKISILSKSNNVNGRILLLEVVIEDNIYELVNFYNSNNVSGQINTLSELNNFSIKLLTF